MRAQLTQRALRLVLGLLLLSPVVVVKGGCPGSYNHLLSQLRSQADQLKDNTTLLQPYMHLQGLSTNPHLKEACMEAPEVFPSEKALRGLSKRSFLRTVTVTLDRIQRGMAALPTHLLQLKQVQTAKRNIQGVRNNIYCMSELLNGYLETPVPTLVGRGALLPPALTTDTYHAKMEVCYFLSDYHRFMGSVGQVFREWGHSLSRSRRHSPRLDLRKGARRIRPFRRGKRPVPRGQLLR
ncbi:oncostatin-M [Ctenodactylus gundi]